MNRYLYFAGRALICITNSLNICNALSPPMLTVMVYILPMYSYTSTLSTFYILVSNVILLIYLLIYHY